MSAYVDAFSGLETDGLADGEQPFCDLTFDLVNRRIAGRRKLFGADERALGGTAMATTPRGEVGFAFEMAPVDRWRSQIDDGLSTAWGCITLRSVGAPTDRLLQEYRDWFSLDGDSAATEALVAPAVIIGGSVASFEHEKVRAKLFLQHAEDDETYSEVYLNIDLPASRVELKEKDIAYRAKLVGWFQGSHGQPDVEWLR
jgi:hypothetical protein